MSRPREVISPLRKGATGRSFVVGGAMGPHFSGHPIPPLSSCGSLCMVQILPQSIAHSSKAPDWASGEATKQFKVACTMLRAKMVGVPHEVERQFLLNGDAESLWTVEIAPRTSTSSRKRRG